MRIRASIFLKRLLTVLVFGGIILSPDVRNAQHEPSDIMQILADHQADIERHGHAHEDIGDLLAHVHGHAHDAAEHDHNVMFMPPRVDAAPWASAGKDRWLVDNTQRQYATFDLERPPRV